MEGAVRMMKTRGRMRWETAGVVLASLVATAASCSGKNGAPNLGDIPAGQGDQAAADGTPTSDAEVALGAEAGGDALAPGDAPGDGNEPADGFPPDEDAADTDDAAAMDDWDTVKPVVEPGRVLLLDFEMRHPVSWRFLIEEMRGRGHEVAYRRWFPHVTVDDITPADGAGDGSDAGAPPCSIIVVSTGNGPGEPSERMRKDDEDRLVSFVQAGGTLVLLVRHTWLDGYGGDSEWLYFNRILERLSVGIRVQRNTAIGFSNVSVGGKPPKHIERPQSYPGSLEWTIDYPTAYTTIEHPAMASVPPVFAAGVTSTLACQGKDLEVFAWTHKSVLLWRWQENKPGAVITPLAEQPLAVGAAVEGGGYVLVMPRSFVQLPVHTEYMSDKPILNFDQLDGTAKASAAILGHVSKMSADPSVHWPTSCIVLPEEGLFSAHGDGLPDVGGGEQGEISATTPPSQRPVPEVLPGPPDAWQDLYSDLPMEDAGAEVSTPAWYRQGRARLGYGGVRPKDEMKAFFDKAIANGIDSFVVTIDPQWLVESAAGVTPAGLIELAEMAEQSGANLFLGVTFLTGKYAELKAEVGSAVGAWGQVLEAPPPLSDKYWEEAIRPLFLGAATAASQHPGILGLHFDMELYGAGSLWYAQGYAFDDDTWGRILAVLEEADPALSLEAAALKVGDRLPWLVDEGLVARAFGALEDETAGRCAALREEARAIRPELELAFYGVMVSTAWFYKGWMRGLGTPERPVTHLSYDIATSEAEEIFHREGIAVRIVGGILGVLFTPTDLQKGLYNAGERADGYWLFQFTDFPYQWDPQKPPKMNGTPDEYWDAISSANALLDAAGAP